ncbi:MAG: D-alanine--D-alanine ligase [Spirochaetaceae bacterium]|jgi:D-alanine-D-alanine ligase|nr:D-alanine--D-alanine ligase [Spirochaetaceae bacterium]
MKKIRVGILCGGVSAEHEVSLQSAKNVVDALDREKFEPELIGIDKNGRWLLQNPENFLAVNNGQAEIKLNSAGTQLAFAPNSRSLILCREGEIPQPLKIDIVFPILHGPFGEDGTVQGLLKLMNIPFVGSGILGSAAGMDKDIMKRILRDGGVPVGAFWAFNAYEKAPSYEEAAARLGTPLWVKPANMGSSIGVSKVHAKNEWDKALALAFQYDAKIILEEHIEGREIECAILDGDTPLASVPGEIKSTHEFYSYDAKYLDANGAVLDIPARLDKDLTAHIQSLALKTFQLLLCEGLSRVDFFVTADNKILVNEINTMPGFTKISMYPKLLDASGIHYTELITRLIETALSRAGACSRTASLPLSMT